jgi:hypothetical protein
MTLPLEQSMEDGKSNETAVMDTDRELWREPTDEVGMEYYQPSIHVTKRGGIGINVGGTVIVKSLRDWHALAMPEFKAHVEAQRRSWVIGELMLTHDFMTREEAERHYDAAAKMMSQIPQR